MKQKCRLGNEAEKKLTIYEQNGRTGRKRSKME
jgi:hypothetical protein